MTHPQRSLLKDPVHLCSLGFGAGLAPRAPGTVGTLVGVPLVIACQALPDWPYYLAILVLVSTFGIWCCGRTARALGVADHPAIVWDEIAGYLLTMFMAPVGWPWLLTGFVLFRCFDILKPWPVSWADRHLHGGLGVMTDDLLAGLYSLTAMQGIAYIVAD